MGPGGRRDNGPASGIGMSTAQEGRRQGENCMVCGEGLAYHDRARSMVCVYCGRNGPGHIVCRQGHHVCEACHNQEVMEVIEALILASRSSDPAEICELAFTVSRLPMLGCEHALIAGGALMAAIRNAQSPGAVVSRGGARVDDAAIMEVFVRTRKQAHGGYCGLTGVCGIVPALGAVVSILTSARCGSDREQRLVMELCLAVGRRIAELTGPSCCKAYVRAALPCAVGFLRRELGIALACGAGGICRDQSRHPHGCRGAKCPYSGGVG